MRPQAYPQQQRPQYPYPPQRSPPPRQQPSPQAQRDYYQQGRQPPYGQAPRPASRQPYPQGRAPAQPSQRPPTAQQPSGGPAASSNCSRCGSALRYITEYSEYYCDRCQEYPRYFGTDSAAEQVQKDTGPTSAEREVGPGEAAPEFEAEPKESEDIDFDDIFDEEDDSVLAEKISSSLKKIKQIISDKEEEGNDVSEIQELYIQCGNVFASDDLYTATHYIESIEKMLKKLSSEESEAQRKDEIDDLFDEAPTDEEATGAGASESDKEPVGGSEPRESVQGFDNGVVVVEEQTEPIDDWELEDKPEIGDKEKAIHALESAKTAIIDADGDGFDTSTAKKVFRQARPLYESKHFQQVIDNAREVEREVLRIKGLSEHEIQEILGEPTRKSPGQEAEEVTEEKMTDDQRKRLLEMINKIWVLFKEASEHGLDTGTYKDLLERAKRKRTFSKAKKMVEAVEEEVKEKLHTHLAEQHNTAANMFHHVRSEIQGAAKLGIEVQPYKDMLDTASTAISLTHYDDAVITLERCLAELKSAKSSVQTQAQATTGASPYKHEPVWDEDEEELPEDLGMKSARRADAKKPDLGVADKVHDDLTDEKRLELLEDRFILGEISEATYRDLKEGILKRMGKR
jgi:hypothetical protein